MGNCVLSFFYSFGVADRAYIHNLQKVNDVNLLVVVNATNCIEKLATGLRQSFAQYKSLVS